jgi:hypothetical protein
MIYYWHIAAMDRKGLWYNKSSLKDEITVRLRSNACQNNASVRNIIKEQRYPFITSIYAIEKGRLIID